METAIRASQRVGETEEWALVLAAAGIAHRVEATQVGWALLVDEADADAAHAALVAYDDDVAREPETARATVADAASLDAGWETALVVAAMLLGFFAITGEPEPGSRWFDRGGASAAAIASGEWWRAVTALTLHLDPVHVVSNAVATAILLPPLVQRLGPGLALALMLLSGAVSNLLGAAVHDPGHVAVGASTATFGAIGLLAALRIVPRTAVTTTRSKPWMIVAATLALLAMLGSGRGSDVLGHALGVVSGAVLGLGVGAALPRPPGFAIQAALVAASGAVVVGAWRLALGGSLW
jgi:membrane associated rhomboid family serine protease